MPSVGSEDLRAEFEAGSTGIYLPSTSQVQPLLLLVLPQQMPTVAACVRRAMLCRGRRQNSVPSVLGPRGVGLGINWNFRVSVCRRRQLQSLPPRGWVSSVLSQFGEPLCDEKMDVEISKMWIQCVVSVRHDLKGSLRNSVLFVGHAARRSQKSQANRLTSIGAQGCGSRVARLAERRGRLRRETSVRFRAYGF